MLLIAGGQFDTNIAVLAARLARRNIAFHHLSVGPQRHPQLRIDMADGALHLDGAPVRPTALFIRQDVFLDGVEDLGAAHARALNWYQAVRGWAFSQPDIAMFNRRTMLQDNNKIANLLAARQAGLRVPDTIVTTQPELEDGGKPSIVKPVAGGAYTRSLDPAAATIDASYPVFLQPQLLRPELRLYRIGTRLLGFALNSPELDYRQTRDVTIEAVAVPDELGRGLTRLCERLELDFAAADFMADDQGRWHFLEVNTQPMYAAFDRVSDGAVCDAIIDALTARMA